MIYPLINLAPVKSLGLSGVASSEVVMADLMRKVFGPDGVRLIGLLILPAALSTMNGAIITGALVGVGVLLTELNVALIPQLEKMKPGSRIVSHLFGMESVEPDVEVTVYHEGGKSNKVYLLTTPLKRPRPPLLRRFMFGSEKK